MIMKKHFIALSLLAMTSFSSIAFADEATLISYSPLRETSIKQTLSSIAYAAGKELIVNGKLDGTTLPIITNRTLEDALDILAKANNFEYVIQDNVILVGPVGGMLMQTQNFPVTYGADLKTIKEQLATFIPAEKMAINTEYQTITVTGTPAQLQRVADVLQNVDKPLKRIQLKVQIVEMNRSDAEKLGIKYTMPTFDSSTESWKGWHPQYTVTFDAETIVNKGRIIARPEITLSNGRTAKILTGEKQPILTRTRNGSGSDAYTTTTVEYKDIGISIDGTARVAPKGNIVAMDIKPSMSSITGWVTNSDTKAPVISTREASTTVSVRSGDTIIIGGLIKEEDIKTMTSLPGLSKLPIIGALFKSKDNTKYQSEIFIFVTPTVLPDPDENVGLGLVQPQPVTPTVPDLPVIPAPAAPPVDTSVKDNSTVAVENEKTVESTPAAAAN